MRVCTCISTNAVIRKLSFGYLETLDYRETLSRSPNIYLT